MKSQSGDDWIIQPNIEAEQALLGSLLLQNAQYAKVAPYLKGEHFFEIIHRQIYHVVAETIEAGKVANPITVRSFLPEKIGEIGIREYLARLAGGVVSMANTNDLGRLIYEDYLRRRALATAKDYMAAVKDMGPGVNLIDVLDDAMSELATLHGLSKGNSRISTYAEVLSRGIDRASAVRSGAMPSFDWMIPEMTATLGPLRAGWLVGMMSDSGGGKTSLALQQGRYLAQKGIPNALFSIEITDLDAAMQAASQHLKIPMERLDTLNLNVDEMNAVGEEATNKDLPYWIIEFSNCSLSTVRAQATALKRQHGVEFIMIDHAKLMELPGRDNGMWADRVNSLYRGLKGIAKELGIVILIQRNDSWKQRGDPRPLDVDAYGGPSVKQNLDVMFSLYRPELFEDFFTEMQNKAKKEEEKEKIGIRIHEAKGHAWIINHKRRRGEPMRSRKICFDGPTTTFSSPIIYQPELLLGTE